MIYWVSRPFINNKEPHLPIVNIRYFIIGHLNFVTVSRFSEMKLAKYQIQSGGVETATFGSFETINNFPITFYLIFSRLKTEHVDNRKSVFHFTVPRQLFHIRENIVNFANSGLSRTFSQKSLSITFIRSLGCIEPSSMKIIESQSFQFEFAS